MICAYHLCDKQAKEKYCSKNCGVKHWIHLNRQKVKTQLVALLGGACNECGYDRCFAALDFHHKGDKEAIISTMIANKRPFRLIKKEALKCRLLCKNCHAEHHDKEFMEKCRNLVNGPVC